MRRPAGYDLSYIAVGSKVRRGQARDRAVPGQGQGRDRAAKSQKLGSAGKLDEIRKSLQQLAASVWASPSPSDEGLTAKAAGPADLRRLSFEEEESARSYKLSRLQTVEVHTTGKTPRIKSHGIRTGCYVCVLQNFHLASQNVKQR